MSVDKDRSFSRALMSHCKPCLHSPLFTPPKELDYPSRLTLAGGRAQPRGLVWVTGVSQERCELSSDRKRLSYRKTKRHGSNVLAYLSLKVLENKPAWMTVA